MTEPPRQTRQPGTASGHPMEGRRPAWATRLHGALETVYGALFRLIAVVGIPPSFIVVLEVPGRRSGKMRSNVLIAADHESQRYLVSVPGEQSDWVRNVRAAGGSAVIRHGRRRSVLLKEVPIADRGPVLKSYLKRSLGARTLFPVSHKAPVEEFAGIAASYPVFHVTTRSKE